MNETIAKYEKGGKYLPTLQDATGNNYSSVKSILKSNVTGAWLIKLNANSSRNKNCQAPTLPGVYFYFYISIRIFCTLLNRFVFECYVPNIRLISKAPTYQVIDFTVLKYFTLNLDSLKFSEQLILTHVCFRLA